MANVLTFTIAAFLMTFAPGAAIAMSPQQIPSEVKSCKAIIDDRERLKCFDGLFAEPSKPQKLPEEKQGEKSAEDKQVNWSIDETKSSTDGSPQVVAANLVGDTVLILRCKNQTTEAAFSTQFNYLGYKSVDVELRINDRSSIKQVWKASMNGRAAFAPDAIAFIQSLPDNGELSIKTTRSTDGKVKEGKFNLGAVSEVRNKIANACNWDNAPEDVPVGSIDHQEKR
jgi:type VI secretion system VasI family protein